MALPSRRTMSMRARSYIETFKQILEGGVGVLKVVAGSDGKLKKRPRILSLAGAGKASERALVLKKPRTSREHALFAKWRGGAWCACTCTAPPQAASPPCRR